MKKCTPFIASLLSLLVTGIVWGQAPEMAPAEPADMVSLFNGKDLTDWDGDPDLWCVKDGVIRGQTTKEKPARGNTFLVCQSVEPADFELRLSFRVSSQNNSGVQYRSRLLKPSGKNRWRMQGYQHEIRNSVALPNVAGFVYDESGTRARVCLVGERGTWENGKKKTLGKTITAAEYAKLFKVDQWNDIVIIAKGNHLKHYMNGRLVTDFTDVPPFALKKGKIGLQLHGGVPMWCEYKNIRIKQN